MKVLKIRWGLLRIIILLTMISGSLDITGQDIEDHDDHDEEEHFAHHDHHVHEIGIGIMPVYFVKEKEFTKGIHAHYIYNIPHSKFGLGLAYERIFDEHKHRTYALVASYRLVEKLNISISPGIAYEEEEELISSFAIHTEFLYEFEFDHIHIGPLLEFAYDQEDFHISLGVHFGMGF